MGGGASSTASGKTKTKDADASDFDVSGAVSAQWLLTCIEQERREKEWLAQKYDERCSEVRALREQLAQARGLPASHPGVDDPAASQADELVSPSNAGGSLSERRSLTLNVQTPGGRKPALKGALGGAQEAAGTGTVIPVHLPSQTADEYGEPPLDRAVASGTDSQGPSLFARRASIKDPDSPLPGVQAKIPETLSVSKVFSMVHNPDEEPISPKRAGSVRRKGSTEF